MHKSGVPRLQIRGKLTPEISKKHLFFAAERLAQVILIGAATSSVGLWLGLLPPADVPIPELASELSITESGPGVPGHPVFLGISKK